MNNGYETLLKEYFETKDELKSAIQDIEKLMLLCPEFDCKEFCIHENGGLCKPLQDNGVCTPKWRGLHME